MIKYSRELDRDFQEANDNLTEKACENSEITAELKIAKVTYSTFLIYQICIGQIVEVVTILVAKYETNILKNILLCAIAFVTPVL